MTTAALLVLADLRAARTGLRGTIFARFFTVVFIVGPPTKELLRTYFTAEGSCASGVMCGRTVNRRGSYLEPVYGSPWSMDTLSTNGLRRVFPCRRTLLRSGSPRAGVPPTVVPHSSDV